MDADLLYERLLEPIEARMMPTFARIVKGPDEAADLFQEVLVTIWHKLDTTCGPQPSGLHPAHLRLAIL